MPDEQAVGRSGGWEGRQDQTAATRERVSEDQVHAAGRVDGCQHAFADPPVKRAHDVARARRRCRERAEGQSDVPVRFQNRAEAEVARD